MKSLRLAIGACLISLPLNLAAKKNEDPMETTHQSHAKIKASQPTPMQPIDIGDGKYVYQGKLDNGLTVLVRPVHSIPKVSIQLWYNVGSKDEKTGEKGIAHLIEHMIFKGTTGKNSLNLSESDINIIAHKWSGYTNAFTSYDYTGYLFNFPVQNWQDALPIMADCMSNCAFKEDHLSSEMKAVIQELKMRKDNYILSLAEAMRGLIFADHPYHYPVIGYKQDLWNVRSADLKAFYKKHYMPNNATLVVVGDVQPEEVLEQARQSFGKIPAQPEFKKEQFFHNKDIESKSITLYRDVQQPQILLAFAVPGSSAEQDHLLSAISLLLGAGKGSRLNKKIVDELHLATSLQTFVWELFEHSLFFIVFEPKELGDVPAIKELINCEIADIVANGVTDQELERAINQTRMAYYSLLENTQDQAYEIGKQFLATQDLAYLRRLYLEEVPATLQDDIKAMLAQYFRPSVMHQGSLLPLPEQEVAQWAELQKESDELDKKILSARIRTTPLEEPNYANKVKSKDGHPFVSPKPELFNLSNGIKVFSYNNQNSAKIDLILELKAKSYYEPRETEGLYNFMACLLNEGTENYTASEFADELETRGMSLSVSPGAISLTMLKSDLCKGLELLMELLTRATFPENEIEKVRTQILAEIKNFWDNPSQFSGQLIREQVYKGHPYSKNGLGTEQIIKNITRDQIVDLYKKYLSPDGAKVAIVGDLTDCDLRAALEDTLGTWHGPKVQEPTFPQIPTTQHQEVNYPINRDQVVLCFVNLSIDRKHPDFDKLLVFDQVFGGGALGSMSSRLFKLREQSGLFYTIKGSLTTQSDEQPGMVMVKTLVSMDRLKEAEKAIKATLQTATDTLTAEEFQEAKDAIINSLMLNFESNKGIASAFLLLDKYKFPADYFDKRAATLAKLTPEQVLEAVKKVLHPDNMITLRVGRVK